MLKMIALAVTLAQVVAAQACVTEQNSENSPFTYFYNGCRTTVMVRFTLKGGGTGLSDRIRPGSRGAVSRIMPGSRYSWCEVGDKTYWTCN